MRALALVDSPDHVCCRYRIRAFEPALAAAGWSLDVRGFEPGTIARWSQLRRMAGLDTVIIQRKLLPGWDLRALRRSVRHLVFDFDDAVLYRDSYDPRGPVSRRRFVRFARTVRLADTVIAGNDFLADCALRAGARADRVFVIPTCVDVTRYRPAARDATPSKNLDLVWIGSTSTLKGVEQRRPLWERLGREVPGVRLRVVCDTFPTFDAMPVVPIPWSEATEAEALGVSDVGVSWIPDDLWSRGKCGLKTLQYQAAGLPVIANPVGVQSEMVVAGVSGFLAETDEEWLGAVKSLAADAARRRAMGAAGRASVESGYSVNAWAETFVAAVAGGAKAARSSPSTERAAPSRPHFGSTKRVRDARV
jgi:glycosyltransferase involved in cell wall biosynthesis